MVGVVTSGTGGSVNFGGMAIAGKTGTTTDYKDVWFAGYTPYYTATCWTGFDNGEYLTGAEKNLSKTLWRTVMSKLHENLEYKSFEIPPGITQATICSRSGLLPISGLCDGTTRTEYFAEGTIPNTTCDVHYSGYVCMATGLPASDTCPFKVPGVLELSPHQSAAVQAGCGQASITSTTLCHHNAAFFTNPANRDVLIKEQADLAMKGYPFSIDGYFSN